MDDRQDEATATQDDEKTESPGPKTPTKKDKEKKLFGIAALKAHVMKERGEAKKYEALDQDADGHRYCSLEIMAAARGALRERIALEQETILKEGQPDEQWKADPAVYDFTRECRQPYLFGHTVEDMLNAYLRWGRKEDDKMITNIDKTFIRLKTYAEFMWENEREATEPPISEDEVRATQKEMGNSWYSHLNLRDKQGHVLMMVQMGNEDRMNAFNLEPSAVFRYMLFVFHAWIYVPQAQDPGIRFIADMGKVTFRKSVSHITGGGGWSKELKKKIAKITQGMFPSRLKGSYIINQAFWMSALIKFAKLFMSAKIKSRIHVLGSNHETLHAEVIDLKDLPKEMGGEADFQHDRYMDQIFLKEEWRSLKDDD